MKKQPKIHKSIAQEVIIEFQKTIISLFKENLCFAFICGSVAKEKNRQKSDIDVFIATRKTDDKMMSNFKNWYLNFHLMFGFAPDHVYSGEVVSVDNLNSALKLASNSAPVKIITKKKLYDGIVWSGMLSSKIIGFCGDNNMFKNYRQKSQKICQKWAQTLLGGELYNYQIDIDLKKIIVYQS